MEKIKYVFYSIGITDSRVDEADLVEQISMKHLKALPEDLKKQMIILLRETALNLEVGFYNN